MCFGAPSPPPPPEPIKMPEMPPPPPPPPTPVTGANAGPPTTIRPSSTQRMTKRQRTKGPSALTISSAKAPPAEASSVNLNIGT